MNRFEYVIKLLDEDKQLRIDAVSSGACKTFDEYQHLCGQIQALGRAQDKIKELAERMETADE